jgi:uncharacterized SAM-binding protein YcdF (DUF218 family)
MFRKLVTAAGLTALLLGLGFLWFVNRLPQGEVPMTTKADAIVVLTGSAFRIADALELLAAGHGKRLLITGVYPDTKLMEIARMTPQFEKWFACCVDLDHVALDTIGNAVETKRWAREKEVKSLIIVTSDFHLPRAMAEIAHELPDVALVPFPVVSDRVRVETWWSSPATARLLFLEYLKYMVALARMRLHAFA